MFETVQRIIADQMGLKDPEKVTMDTVLDEDLGADSLDAVEIIMAIEDTYDIEIPDDIAENIRRVSEIMAYLEDVLEDEA